MGKEGPEGCTSPRCTAWDARASLRDAVRIAGEATRSRPVVWRRCWTPRLTPTSPTLTLSLTQVKILLENGLDANAGDYDRRTALHLACAENQNRVVAVLIEKGADISVKDRWGVTPLEDAIKGMASECRRERERAERETHTGELPLRTRVTLWPSFWRPGKRSSEVPWRALRVFRYFSALCLVSGWIRAPPPPTVEWGEWVHRLAAP
jgi:hypothetical protein